MNGFLSKIIDDISEEELPNLHTTCYVFPTRRSCVIFKKILLERFEEHTYWAPAVLSIEDFIIESTGKNVTDDVALIFELFIVYKEHDKESKFQDFYPWGQILLKDFDEIDRYLGDGKSIYEGLKNIREIESRFNSNDELLQIIQKFRHIVEGSQTALFQQFAKTWEIVRQVYSEYKEHLISKGMAYSGMLYRQLANDLQLGTKIPNYERITFGGFNALSKAEEEIINALFKERIGVAYWDADLTYLEDKKDEAGVFLRDYKERWKTDRSKWIVSDQRSNSKNIVCVGAAEGVGQSRAASSILKSEYLEGTLSADNTAVAFGDEGLLFPVLHSLPNVYDNVNVTMGYPMKNSSLMHLADHFVGIYSKKAGAGKGYFMRAPVMTLALNPFIYPLVGEVRIAKLRGSASAVVSSLDLDTIFEGSVLSGITSIRSTTEEILQELIKLLYAVFYAQEGSSESLVEKELIYHFVKEIINFDKRLKLHKVSLEIDILRKLILEALQSVRVPFSGEPVSGLQLMGFLETRALDFENIIVLSVNEGKLPAASNQSSYISYSLRKAFDLPTHEEQDAIYAYHFKRLLQRAKNIWLIYNTELAFDGTGEKSRFILQLMLESQKYGRDLKTVNYGAPVVKQLRITPPTIPKTKDVFAKLDRFLTQDQLTLEGVPRLSPSALITYIHCPLQFYFKYVARLRERDDEQLDSLEPRNFGNIVHRALDILYRPLIGKEINNTMYAELKELIPSAVKHAFIEERKYETIKGKDLLTISISESIIKKVVKNDLEQDGFRVIDIETNVLNTTLKVDSHRVELGGVVDRIDRVKLKGEEVSRIIDYKTGNVQYVSSNKIDDAEFVAKHFESSKYKTGFQALYYSYLFSIKYPEEAIMPGIYELKKVGKGIRHLQSTPLSNDLLVNFGNKLHDLLSEIYDEQIPFSPIKDEKDCRICAYKSICHR